HRPDAHRLAARLPAGRPAAPGPLAGHCPPGSVAGTGAGADNHTASQPRARCRVVRHGACPVPRDAVRAGRVGARFDRCLPAPRRRAGWPLRRQPPTDHAAAERQPGSARSAARSAGAHRAGDGGQEPGAGRREAGDAERGRERVAWRLGAGRDSPRQRGRVGRVRAGGRPAGDARAPARGRARGDHFVGRLGPPCAAAAAGARRAAHADAGPRRAARGRRGAPGGRPMSAPRPPSAQGGTSSAPTILPWPVMAMEAALIYPLVAHWLAGPDGRAPLGPLAALVLLPLGYLAARHGPIRGVPLDRADVGIGLAFTLRLLGAPPAPAMMLAGAVLGAVGWLLGATLPALIGYGLWWRGRALAEAELTADGVRDEFLIVGGVLLGVLVIFRDAAGITPLTSAAAVVGYLGSGLVAVGLARQEQAGLAPSAAS